MTNTQTISNLATGSTYGGKNSERLAAAMEAHGYNTPAFCTFSQALKLGLAPRKGEKSPAKIWVKNGRNFMEIPVFNAEQLESRVSTGGEVQTQELRVQSDDPVADLVISNDIALPEEQDEPNPIEQLPEPLRKVIEANPNVIVTGIPKLPEQPQPKPQPKQQAKQPAKPKPTPPAKVEYQPLADEYPQINPDASDYSAAPSFTIAAKELKRVLKFLKPFYKRNAGLYALEHVLILVGKGAVIFRLCNGNHVVGETTSPCTPTVSGYTAIPYPMLVEVAKAAKQTVELRCSTTSHEVSTVIDSSLTLNSVEQLYMLNLVDQIKDINFKRTTLYKIPQMPELAALTKFIGKEEYRPAMCGVCMEYTVGYGNTPRFIASDGFGLITVKPGNKPSTEPEESMALIIPADAIAPAIADGMWRIDIANDRTDTPLCIHTNNGTIYCTAIDDKFPAWRNVMPSADSANYKLTVNAKQLAQAAETLGKNSKVETNGESSPGVKLTASNGELFVSNNAGTIKMGCKLELLSPSAEPSIEIGFSYSLLNRALNAATTEDAVLEISTPTRGAVIREPNQTLLTMPMRIQ